MLNGVHMKRTRKRDLRLSKLALAIGVVVALSAVYVGYGYAVGERPPDWTTEDWAALSAEEQTLEWNDYDDGTGNPAEKAPWVAANPEESFDSELDALAAEDGAGIELTVGISDSSVGLFGEENYIFQNQWQDLNGGQTELIQVYAGDYVDSRACSGVLVINRLPWPNDGSGNPIGSVTEVPGADSGPVTITGASGRILGLRTMGGDWGFYNVDTGEIEWFPIGAPPPEVSDCLNQ
jgi:hypothetical protein